MDGRLQRGGLHPGARAPISISVLADIDRLLAPYGGLGAYGRKRPDVSPDHPGRARPEPDDGHRDSGGVPRRRRLPAQHRARPADRHPAHRDRRAQGVRLQQPRGRPALPAVRDGGGAGGRARRHRRRASGSAAHGGPLRRLLRLSRSPPTASAGVWWPGRRPSASWRPAAARSARCAAPRACRRPKRCGPEPPATFRAGRLRAARPVRRRCPPPAG